MTFRSYAQSWLARKASRLKASTAAHYAETLATRILPVLGDAPLAALTRGRLLDWVVWAEDARSRAGRPFARATLGSWWRVLKTVSRDAAAEIGLPDPTLRVEAPRSRVRNVRERATLTGAQLGTLLRVVEARHPAWYAEVFVAAFTGMRAGELYALAWGDVDAEAGVIHVRRAHWRGVVGTTKTDDPREVAVTPAIRAVLDAHRVRRAPVREGDLLFPTDDGGFRGPEALRNLLRSASAEAGLPLMVTPQVLRRTFNTLALEAGVNEVILRAQMGHVEQAMTRRYAGVHASAKQEAVNRLHALVTTEKEASVP